jgi:oxygen-independent coproporphyrinogen-3 oxidase
MLAEKIIAHPWFSRRFAEYYRWYPKSLTLFNSNLFDLSDSTIKGMYIHIPYCDQICKFCPYNKLKTDPSDYDDYVSTLLRELKIYKRHIGVSDLEYVYFGGGTPSVLSVDQVGSILEQINELFGLNSKTEISFEAHPTHLRKDYINSLKQLGITRISTGIQSFDANRLKVIGATHGEEDSLAACRALSDNMDNWGVDLLYRCQGQSVKDWESELTRCLEFRNIKHISCYTLSLADSTQQPSPEDDAAMASLAYEYLRSQSFDHYASCATGGFDLAKKGYTGIYEKKHWEAPQDQYLGIGAGAFGYVGRFLTINHHNLKRYAEIVNGGSFPILSARETSKLEERHRYFVLGVKTMEVNLEKYTKLFSSDPLLDFHEQIALLEEEGLIEVIDDKLNLTEVGRFYVDQVSEQFWSDEQKSIQHPETPALRKLERLTRI